MKRLRLWRLNRKYPVYWVVRGKKWKQPWWQTYKVRFPKQGSRRWKAL